MIYYLIGDNVIFAILYLFVWGIPVLLATYEIKTKNLFVTHKRKNNIKINIALASILFGILTCGKEIYYDDKFHAVGVMWMVYAIVAFGVPMYIFWSCLYGKKIKKVK